MAVKGAWVSFRIGDVSFPTPEEVLAALYGDEVLRGLVVDVSSRETQDAMYAVVIVDRLPRPLVVAIDRLRDVPCVS